MVMSSGDARQNWADVQKDAQEGCATVVQQFGKTTAVIVPPEWGDLFVDEHYAGIIGNARKKFPNKTDAGIVKEILQRFAWASEAGGKDGKLDKILAGVERIERCVCGDTE